MERAFLGLQPTDDERVWLMPVAEPLIGAKGQLFGGFAIGAAVTVFEGLTGRTARWATGQFYKMTFPGDVLTLRLELMAEGRSIVQGQVSFEAEGQQVIHVLVGGGAKSYPTKTQGPVMPPVLPPDDCGPRLDFGLKQVGIIAEIDVRLADVERISWSLVQPHDRTPFWMRIDDTRSGDPISLAVMADFIPPAVSAAAADDVFASSLDNTIRYIETADEEWILVDFQIEAIREGIAHATSRLWAPNGRLLAVGSQTCGVSPL